MAEELGANMKFETILFEAIKIPKFLKTKKRIGKERAVISDLKTLKIYLDMLSKSEIDLDKEKSLDQYLVAPNLSEYGREIGINELKLKDFLSKLKLFNLDYTDPSEAKELLKLVEEMIKELS